MEDKDKKVWKTGDDAREDAPPAFAEDVWDADGEDTTRDDAAGAEADTGSKADRAGKEQKTVTIEGRATKRRKFFDKHTGPAAQLLAVAVVLFAAGSILFTQCEKNKPDPVDDASSAPQSVSYSAPSVAEPVLLPPVSEPFSHEEEAPEPGYPVLSFTEAEVAELDEMLAAWAAEATFIDQRPEDEAGNKVGEPVYEPDGGHRVAVWFHDIHSGATYAYNAEESLSYASLMKAPYAMYLYQLAEAGQCDLSQEIAINGGDVAEYSENTGVIKTMPLPQTHTVEALIGYMIRESDTVALKTLLRSWPAEGFVEWAGAGEIPGVDVLGSVLYGRLCAQDAGAWMLEMWEYITEGQHGATLREHMLNTRNAMITSEAPVVRKYGWDVAAYHDMAIVETEHPYLLVIMTDKYGGSWGETQMFSAIAARLEEMMAAKWLGAG